MWDIPLPVIDLSSLSSRHKDDASTRALATQLGKAFEDEGFAYLVNIPLSFNHEQVFEVAKSFFQMPETEKLHLAKKNFRRNNGNTYRG